MKTNYNPRLYLDCDGVLADFDTAFKHHFGTTPKSYENKYGTNKFWETIKIKTPNFYRELPLMKDAKELFDATKELRPLILTGCPKGGWAEPQKLAWGQEHFKGTPMIVCKSVDKRNFCQPGDILVDDRTKYEKLWIEAGGIFVHHKNTLSTIQTLKNIQII